eukprot:1194458-Prorocentrum_minimum.AAC.8
MDESRKFDMKRGSIGARSRKSRLADAVLKNAHTCTCAAAGASFRRVLHSRRRAGPPGCWLHARALRGIGPSPPHRTGHAIVIVSLCCIRTTLSIVGPVRAVVSLGRTCVWQE